MHMVQDKEPRKEDDPAVLAATLKAAIDSMPEAVFISDTEGNVIHFNEAFATFHKFKNKHECARTLKECPVFLDVYLPDGSLARPDQWAVPRALRGETCSDAELTLKRKDTGETWIGCYNFAPIRDAAGAIVGSVVTARDITERRAMATATRAERNLMASILETIPVGVVTLDAEGLVTSANPRAAAILGLTKDDPLHMTYDAPIWRIAALDGAPFPTDKLPFSVVMATGKPVFDVRHAIHWPDGRRIALSINAAPVIDEKGHVSEVIAVFEDITELDRAEEARRKNEIALQESEAKYRLLVQSTSDPIFSASPDGTYRFVNDAYAKLLNLTPADIVGKTPRDIFSPAAAEARLALLRQAFASGKRQSSDVQLVTRTGEVRHAQSWIEPFFDDQGKPLWALGIVHDMTDVKRAELAVEETSRRLSLALRAGGLAVWDWNVKTDSMVWDDEMLKLYGLTREQFSGNVEAWKRGLHPEDRSHAIADCQAALDGTRDYNTEFRILQPSGKVKHIKASGLVLRDQSGAPMRMLGLNQDATQQRHAERSYAMLFGEMLNGFALHEIICDAQNAPIDYRFLAVNPAFERMTGLKADTTVGRTVLEVIPGVEKRWIETYGKVALTGEPTVFEDHSAVLQKHFEITAFRPAPGQFACIFADITDRKRGEAEKAKLEAQLRQAHKMESVGRLAGGVAHDFNNMLGVILGHVELALEDLAPNQPIHTNLEEIQKAARRSAGLTRQLLAFARKQAVAPQVLDLNRTVEGMLKMLRRLIGEDIELTWKPDADLWPVNVDPTQIDQILANLCVNARDAIGGVGEISIGASNRSFDRDFSDQNATYIAGDYVQITVSDDGCGMDQATLSHLFEPFFTTKGVGKGTGLGLATVYGIVKQNEGFINVYSEPGRGTTFKLCLPRHRGRVKQVAVGAVAAHAGRNEVILLVEDEPSLLAMTKTMLQHRGYTVLTASAPGEAISIASEPSTEIHLLMTDVVMPGMNGRDLANSLLSLRPRMKCLFMSGYTADVIAHHGVLDDGVSFIRKPFSGEELSAKVREALDRQPSVPQQGEQAQHRNQERQKGG